jgi:hypothetical protein
MRLLSSLVLFIVSCTSNKSGPVTVDPAEGGAGKADGVGGVPDVRCAGAPDAGPATGFNSVAGSAISLLGDPKHRGFDLVAAASADSQTIEGWLAYTIADKALEGEDVDLFACRESAWRKIGAARTDSEGHFALGLSGGDRLPIGLRDMYVSVVGDRTGASFLAIVAPDGAKLVVSDVDGTLTSSENAFLRSVVIGGEPDQQPGAADAFVAIAAKGYIPIDCTARGNQYSQVTRDWFEHKGFPRGALRLSSSFFTPPGEETSDFKTAAIAALDPALAFTFGIGDQHTDVVSYAANGLSGDHIFVKLPEHASDTQADRDAGAATGFSLYDDLRTQNVATW